MVLRGAIIKACRLEPRRVHRHGWGQLLPFETLVADGVISDRDVVKAMIDGYSEQVGTVGAGPLFHLLDPLAASLSVDEADEVLCYGLNLMEDILRPEDGDGPWCVELMPRDNVVAALAAYLWVGLGSPIASVRWEHAHAVRGCVELSWVDILGALAEWAGSGVAGPFADHRLEFYLWHARQWLLLGLARGGAGNPVALRPLITILRQMLAQEHVVIRELAAQSLRLLVAINEPESEKWKVPDHVNSPSLPRQIYTGWAIDKSDEEGIREEQTSDDDKYYFGIDIGPYWFAPMGRAFGITESAVRKRALRVIREKLGGRGGGWRNDARISRRIFENDDTSHRHASLPPTDDLVAYQSYHAMMITAGALLKQRPVRHRSNEGVDEFEKWLRDYLLTREDGCWLADRRDPRIIVNHQQEEEQKDASWRYSIDTKYLDQKLLTDDGLIVFWANCATERETVLVRSALVSNDGAAALLAALQTAPELGQTWLPAAGEDEESKMSSARLLGWVADNASTRSLDEFDPWSKKLRYPGPCPAQGIADRSKLVSQADGRVWRGAGGALLRSETWIHGRGYGRNADVEPGSRLGGNHGFVKVLLDSFPGHQLILSVEVRRQSSRDNRCEDEFNSYTFPYKRFYLMDSYGVPVSL